MMTKASSSMQHDLSFLSDEQIRIVRAAIPKPGSFARFFRALVPPAPLVAVGEGLSFERVIDDVQIVARTCAGRYDNAGHPILNADNLYSEALAKFAELVREGIFEKIRDRKAFFTYVKTSFLRHMQRIVRAQKFTLRRTGLSPLAKDATREERDAYQAALPKELSLDASASEDGYELGELVAGGLEALDEQMRADIRHGLTTTEAMVFDQLLDPNYEAWLYAATDVGWDTSLEYAKPGQSNVRIKFEHMARGVDLELDVFRRVVTRIQTKVKCYMNTGEVFQNEHGPALRRLEELFGLRRIPRTVDAVVIRRMLTIAARDQHQKVTPEIAKLLEAVGAKPPVMQSSTLACFGVLYEKGNRMCSVCGRRAACATESANVGLGEITLSPHLLGAKATRIPAIVPSPRSGVPVFESEAMEEVYAYLSENFFRVAVGDEHYFRHHGGWQPNVGVKLDGNTGLIFHVQGQNVRFCKPSVSLARKLTRRPSRASGGESFYLPDGVSASDAVELISQHARETLADAQSTAF